ncbi:unnamed protein product, partial [Oppiella nova]
MANYATLNLQRQLQEYTVHPNDNFSVGLIDSDVFEWELTLIGPKGTPYEGGLFRAKLTFPKDFPISPPTMQFLCDMWHPN